VAAFASGEAVPLNTFDIPAGGDFTVTFRVTVDSPLGACANAVSNQGTFSGGNFSPLLTDDPASGGSADPTVTNLDAISLSITKTNGTATSAPGAMTTYTIVASNAGPSNAVAATVTDTFPAILTGVTWTCAASGAGSACPAAGSGNINAMVNIGAGGNVTFTATGTIDADASGSLANTASVSAAPNQLECDTGNNSATDTDTLAAEADLSITKDDSSVSVVAGETTTYVITASNSAGPSDATATVADVFPAEISAVSWTCVGAGGGVCPASGSGNLSESVTLPVGGSVTFTAIATVDPTASGTLDNTATVTITGGTDPSGRNNSATDDDTVISRVADLSVTKTDNVDPVPQGGTVTYTIEVENLGPSSATGVVVTDNLPAGLVFVATSGCAEDPAGAPTCTLGTIAPGGSASYTLQASPDSPPPASVTNVASAAGNETDPVSENNSDDETTGLPPEADLSITKDDGATSVIAGETTTYVITATNNGPRDVTATVTDSFPAEISSVSWTCVGAAGGVCPASGSGDLNESVTLPNGGSVTFTAIATVDPSATGTLDNTATVAGPAGSDPAPGNNSATDNDTVIEQEADLSITKDDDVDPPAPGANVTYTIEVENLGPSDAANVVVTDNLPAELTLVSTSGCAEDPAGAPTCTLGTIAAGSSASYTLEVSVDNPPPASVTNTASVTSDATDPISGNNSDDETTTFDAIAPEVTGVDTVADTGNGSLDECETALVEISQILVTFSEDVEDIGPGDPDSASNPANYRLLGPASAGEDFDTLSCAGSTGDDLVTTISTVTYDSGTTTATLDLGGTLGAGLYRLLVCGTTTIRDTAGNPLDGGAGPGSDFALTFRADPGNLLADGHFDDFDALACDPLSSWSSSNIANVELADDDVDGSPLSGSAANAAATTSFDLAQCTAVPADELLRVRGRLRVTGAPGDLINSQVVCDFFDGPGCGGTNLGSQSFFQTVGDTGGDWIRLRYLTPSPPGTVSGLCGFAASLGIGADLDANVDDLFLGEATIFEDGFESGDTSAWSVTVP